VKRRTIDMEMYLVTSASAAKAMAVREKMRKEGRMVRVESWVDGKSDPTLI
jgi:hypothetical protein